MTEAADVLQRLVSNALCEAPRRVPRDEFDERSTEVEAVRGILGKNVHVLSQETATDIDGDSGHVMLSGLIRYKIRVVPNPLYDSSRSTTPALSQLEEKELQNQNFYALYLYIVLPRSGYIFPDDEPAKTDLQPLRRAALEADMNNESNVSSTESSSYGWHIYLVYGKTDGMRDDLFKALKDTQVPEPSPETKCLRIGIEKVRGISVSEMIELKTKLGEYLKSIINQGMPLVYEIYDFVRNFVSEVNKKPCESLHDQMTTSHIMKYLASEDEDDSDKEVPLRESSESMEVSNEVESKLAELSLEESFDTEFSRPLKQSTDADDDEDDDEDEDEDDDDGDHAPHGIGGGFLSDSSDEDDNTEATTDITASTDSILSSNESVKTGYAGRKSSKPPKIDGYSHLHQLKQYDYGCVYRALSVKLRKIVIVKSFAIDEEMNESELTFRKSGDQTPDICHPVNRMKDLSSMISTRFKKGLPHGLVKYFTFFEQGDSFFVVEEFIQNSSTLSSIQDQSAALSQHDILTIIRNLLELLDSLFRVGLFHGELKPNKIYIHRDLSVSLSDYCMLDVVYPCFRGVKLNAGSSFSDFVDSVYHQRRQSDLAAFESIALSLADLAPAGSSEFKTDVKKFAAEVRMRGERDASSGENGEIMRSILDDLLNEDHPFFKELKRSGGVIKTIADDETKTHTISRYKQEYDEIQFLGSGAFGSVVKARNKLDNRIYAIKKIRISLMSEERTDKLLREIRTLSTLCHDNVVRYYYSWIEKADPDSTEDEKGEDNDSEDDEEFDISDDEDDGEEEDDDGEDDDEDDDDEDNDEDGDDSGIEGFDTTEEVVDGLFDDTVTGMSDGDQDSMYNDFGLSDEEESEDNIVFTSQSKNEDTSAAVQPSPNQAKKVHKKRHGKKDKTKKEQFILYLQMEFCEKKTLKTLIDDGSLFKDHDLAWRLFRQICEGLNHIHSKGIIHRDLKPANIFIGEGDTPKIGDFGLSTTSTNFHTDDHRSSSTPGADAIDMNASDSATGGMTTDIGTPVYIAPEVLNSGSKGHGKRFYNQKVDLYSLGVILFEMMYPFPTVMERMISLTRLREAGIVPQHMYDISKDAADVILWCCKKKPEDRPTTTELLRSPRIPLKLEQSILLNAMDDITHPSTSLFSILMEKLFQSKDLSSLSVDDIRNTLMLNYSSVLPSLHMKSSSSSVASGSSSSSPVSSSAGSASGSQPDDFPSLMSDVRAQDAVIAALETIFISHGGVRIRTPVILPTDSSTPMHPEALKLLNDAGVVYSLRADLFSPFLRVAASSNLLRCFVSNGMSAAQGTLRRYDTGTVFRKSESRRVETHLMAQFDILSSGAHQIGVDCEALLLLAECMSQFLDESQFVIRINHVRLLRGILLQAGVSRESLADVAAFLCRESNRRNLEHCKSVLTRMGLTKKSLDIIWPYILVAGSDFNEAMKRSEFAILSSAARQQETNHGVLLKNEGLRELHHIAKLLSHTYPAYRLQIDPFLSVNPKCDGLMFQALVSTSKNLPPSVPVAVGGRFDAAFRLQQKEVQVAEGGGAGDVTLFPIGDLPDSSSITDPSNKDSKTGVADQNTEHSREKYMQGLSGIVGLTFSVDAIAHRFAENDAFVNTQYKKQTFDPEKLVMDSSTIVVSKSSTTQLLTEKLMVASMLWEAGIPTEVMWEQYSSRGIWSIVSYSEERRFHWLVTVRARQENHIIRVKLKCLATQSEVDVPAHQVASIIAYCSGDDDRKSPVSSDEGLPSLSESKLERYAQKLMGKSASRDGDGPSLIASGISRNEDSDNEGGGGGNVDDISLRKSVSKSQFSIPVSVPGDTSAVDLSSLSMFDVKVIRRKRFEFDRSTSERCAARAREMLGSVLHTASHVKTLAVDLPMQYLQDIALDPLHCVRNWDSLTMRHIEEANRRHLASYVDRANDLLALLQSAEYNTQPFVVLYSMLDDQCVLVSNASLNAGNKQPAKTRAVPSKTTKTKRTKQADVDKADW